MNRKFRNIIQCLTLLLSVEPAFADTNSLRIAAIDHNALVVKIGDDSFLAIANGGDVRANPVWSIDGSRVAYLQNTDSRRALGELVVVDLKGNELTRVQIEPVGENNYYNGMRFIENLQWISSNKIAVHGSLNPSQSQYYVIDVATGKVISAFIDDTSSATFSPIHFAYQSGSPQWGKEDTRKATLFVDNQQIFPTGGHQPYVDYLSSPPWSPDGRSLAAVVQNHPHTVSSLIVWRDGVVNELLLPLDQTYDKIDLFWKGNRVYVKAEKTGQLQPSFVWSSDAAGLSLTVLDPATIINPAIEARVYKEKLSKELRGAGFYYHDLWCSTCVLNVLPRKY